MVIMRVLHTKEHGIKFPLDKNEKIIIFSYLCHDDFEHREWDGWLAFRILSVTVFTYELDAVKNVSKSAQECCANNDSNELYPLDKFFIN
uniref:Uncharacterized protein n=1 Tax=Glossina palpalis gambiensis TaxID=67801 RepID=A0A1B0B2N2_9MUSC